MGQFPKIRTDARSSREDEMKRVIAAVILVLGVVNCRLALTSDAQVPSAKPRMSKTESAEVRAASPKVFEDDEVKIPIPARWVIASGDHPAVARQAKSGQLLLEKNGYTVIRWPCRTTRNR